VFAVVRDQDGHAKQHVQALLRQSGRSLETKLRVVSDGEDGMRSLVGKLFNANEQHILDWYHIARRFEAIGKGLVYLPHVEDFEHRLSRHRHHLNRAKWKVWHGNLYGASIALSSFYDEVDALKRQCPDFAVMRKLVLSFARFCVGASRPPCIAGWSRHERRVSIRVRFVRTLKQDLQAVESAVPV
jgi:hypothetical protein